MSDEFYELQHRVRGETNSDLIKKKAKAKNKLYKQIFLKGWLPTDKSVRIVEIACGTGVFMLWLKSWGYLNVKGVDFSGPQIDIANSCGLDVLKDGALEYLHKLENCSIDVIVALDFYEHLTPENFLKFVALSSQKLVSDGALIMRGPNGDSPIAGRALYNDITHKFCLTTNAMSGILLQYDFKHFMVKEESNCRKKISRQLIEPLRIILRKIGQTYYRILTGQKILYWDSSIYFYARKR